MRHNDQERYEYNDRREAKLRDKERGQARKVKNAFRVERPEVSHMVREFKTRNED
jgi:hypothetical protein